MLHYVIAITDNTLPTVIVLALLLFLARSRPRACWYGLALGACIALTYAVLRRNTGFMVREFYDLGVLLPSLFLILALLPALPKLSRAGDAADSDTVPTPGAPIGSSTGADAVDGIDSARKGLLGSLLITLLLTTLAASTLPNIMLYPLDFSVGMESIYNTEFLYKVTGYLLGLLILFLLGLGLYSIAGRMPRRFFLTCFALTLLLYAAKLGLQAAQILMARNKLPAYDWLMDLIIFMLTHGNWFAFALMGVVAFMTITHILRLRLAPVNGGNPAQRRKRKADSRKQLRYSLCILSCLIASTLIITVLRTYANREVELSPPIELPVTGDAIIIPLERINDKNLHRFVYTTKEGTAIRYIVIKKSETAYGVGLDACDICGPSGYYQRKDQVICKLCDVVMNTATIGFPGGCNPVPLRFSISQGNMVIRTQDLDAERKRFK